MALVMAGLQDLAWLRLNAALRHEVPTFKWATVHTSSPGLTIILEGDESQQPRQVSANAVGPLTAGQRVRVEMQGTRITVTAAQMSGFLMPNGDVLIANPNTANESFIRLAQGTGDFTVRAPLVDIATPTVSFLMGSSFILNTDNNFALTTQGYIALAGDIVEIRQKDATSQRSRLSIASTGQVTTWGPNASQFVSLEPSGNTTVRAPGRVRLQGGSAFIDVDTEPGSLNRIRFFGIRSSTAAANAIFATSPDGVMYRSTSIRAAKAAIDPHEVDEDDYLALEPRTWFDKGAADAYADAIGRELDGEDVDYSSVPPIRRIPGLVAEEVIEDKPGNEWLVDRDDDGNLVNVNYERGWIPAIPIIKRLRDRVRDQESRILELEAKVEKLMSLVEEDENNA